MKRTHVAYKLIAAVWRSPLRWRVGLLLLAIGVFSFVGVRIMAELTTYGGRMIDALATRDPIRFKGTLVHTSLLVFAYTVSFSLLTYAQLRAQMEARSAITYPWLRRWLSEGVIYLLEREQRVDNPDQRISEDLNLFTQKSLELLMGGVGAAIGVVIYSAMLWKKGGALSFSVAGQAWVVPGYLFWIALAYTVVNTVLTQRLGRHLVDRNQRQQHFEADFRFNLIQVREHAEQVALYRGAETEFKRLSASFEAVRENWWRLIARQVRLVAYSNVASTGFGFLTYCIFAPPVFSGAMTIGMMTAMSGVFALTVAQLNWFASAWSEVVLWRAVVRRLGELDHAIDLPAPKGVVVEAGARSLATYGLRLNLPNGAALTDVEDFQVLPSQRWLIRGASGAGKSTLLRAIAGLWPYGSGRVETPSKGLLFLPQKSYLPSGTLKAALTYPLSAESVSDEACKQALIQCRLGELAGRLGETARWGQRLSPGEQQRVAFARVLLMRPDYVFLDEATSAIDTPTEQHLYALLSGQLPEAAIVSIAHRESLDRFHDHGLKVQRAPE